MPNRTISIEHTKPSSISFNHKQSHKQAMKQKRKTKNLSMRIRRQWFRRIRASGIGEEAGEPPVEFLPQRMHFWSNKKYQKWKKGNRLNFEAGVSSTFKLVCVVQALGMDSPCLKKRRINRRKRRRAVEETEGWRVVMNHSRNRNRLQKTERNW